MITIIATSRRRDNPEQRSFIDLDAENILNNTGFVGRDSWDIVLDELPLHDCNRFRGKAGERINPGEKLNLLSVTGGVPKYLEELDPALSCDENIRRLCFRQREKGGGKRGQVQFAGTARSVLRGNWTCPLFSPAGNVPFIRADDISLGTNSMNAVDTNVFVYFFDREEPSKQAQATELLDRLVHPPTETVLLWQVAAELLSCLRRWEVTGKRSSADVDADIHDVLAMFPLALPTKDVILRAVDLHSRYSLSHWDSMVVAACIQAGVDTLYSEDLDEGTRYDSVGIVNPFR